MNAAASYHRLTNYLLGDPLEFSPENRSVNAISLITLVICFILLPFNIAFHLTAIVVLLLILIATLSLLYYLARYKKKYILSSILYAIGSYATIIITFCYNDGVDGPALLLFFLTFSLLIGFTSKRMHKAWILLHFLCGAGLITLSYFYPNIVSLTYRSKADRYIDFISSYCVTLFFMYFIIVYLQSAYSTERKLVLKRSKELEESNAQKTKLFSIVAHDLKTPLNGLLGYLELLNTYSIPEEQKKTVEKQLLVSTKQTSEMLTNLLLWAKAQMDGIKPSIHSLPLRNAVQSTVETLKEVAIAKNVNLRFHIDETAIVFADRDMLLMVVRNLVHNAIKFTPANGTVVISCETHAEFVRLIIIDNGVGIPEDKRDDLFTVRTKSSYGTDKEKGFGLGLLLCKEFTEMQGGTIGYASMEQKGSKFYIDLPADKESVLKIQKMKQHLTASV